jgi:hypothetical protein
MKSQKYWMEGGIPQLKNIKWEVCQFWRGFILCLSDIHFWTRSSSFFFLEPGSRAKENGQRSLGSKDAIKLLPAPGVPFFVEDFFSYEKESNHMRGHLVTCKKGLVGGLQKRRR